jgi:hypothetical protein
MTEKDRDAKFKEACPESAKILEQQYQNVNRFAEDLRDGAFQRGIKWRQDKLKAIFNARQASVSDQDILRELRIGGITAQKARELMKDSEELFGR